jgi:glucokinase
MKESKARQAIGLDFGGTSVKIALVNEKGEIKARVRIPTREAALPNTWLDAVARGVEEVCAKEGGLGSITGIGVGVPGFVDFERGFVYDLANVPGWKNVHLTPLMEKRFGVHVRVDNDVNAMALGECTFGAGRIYQHAVFVTLGTGVGGGLLINHALYRGAHSMAGEIGHMSIHMDGIRSPQGRGGLEQYIGNRRIVERAVKFMEEGRASEIRNLVEGDWTRLTPELIGQAAHNGDKLALEIFDFVAECLATAFASVTYLLQPQAFIVGGGVAQSGTILFDPLRRHLGERLSPVFAERIEIKPAELGSDAGLVGGAAVVMMD